jgi:hypothetical protein
LEQQSRELFGKVRANSPVQTSFFGEPGAFSVAGAVDMIKLAAAGPDPDEAPNAWFATGIYLSPEGAVSFAEAIIAAVHETLTESGPGGDCPRCALRRQSGRVPGRRLT